MRTNEKPNVASAPSSNLLSFAVFVVAIGFLGFVAGSYVMLANAFPSGYLTNAYRGGQALLAQKTRFNSPYPSEMWQPARTRARGVTVHDPKRALSGYTLYTSGHAQQASLISMAGEVVREYVNPVRGGEADELIPVVSLGAAHRADPAGSRVSPITHPLNGGFA